MTEYYEVTCESCGTLITTVNHAGYLRIPITPTPEQKKLFDKHSKEAHQGKNFRVTIWNTPI